MIVAARAADGQAEEAARHDVDAIVPLVGARDLDRAVVVEPRAEPEEPERRQRARARRRIAEQIAGELRAHELVVRQVVVERLDHPVAIQIRVRVRVVAAPLRIERAVVVLAVARDVEPEAAPRFAVVRRREQAVDDLRERVGRLVLLERLDLVGRRRQAGQIERRAADQRALVGGAHRRQPVLLEPREHEAIDVGLRPRRCATRPAPAATRSGWNDQNARCSGLMMYAGAALRPRVYPPSRRRAAMRPSRRARRGPGRARPDPSASASISAGFSRPPFGIFSVSPSGAPPGSAGSSRDRPARSPARTGRL